MAKRELTDAYIRKLKVDARIDISDLRCEGLALRATPMGSKTFSVRVRGRDGNAQRVSIGRYPEVSLGEARERAHKVRREIREAEGNVNEIRKAARTQDKNAPSLFDLINEYGAIAARNRRIWQPSKRGGQSEAYRRIMAVFGGLAERDGL